MGGIIVSKRSGAVFRAAKYALGIPPNVPQEPPVAGLKKTLM
jgi:hypothetical protein